MTPALRLAGLRVTGITAPGLVGVQCTPETYRSRNEFATMMTYSFDKSPIYASGNAAAGWAVAGLLFAVLVFA